MLIFLAPSNSQINQTLTPIEQTQKVTIGNKEIKIYEDKYFRNIRYYFYCIVCSEKPQFVFSKNTKCHLSFISRS